MKRFLLLACVPLCLADELTDVSSLLPDASTGVTLDEEAFASIRAEMKACRPTAGMSSDVAAWREAMNATSTEARDATLLCLFLRLNPELNPEAALPELIALLQLHSRAVAGQPEACTELAQALRSGTWHRLHLPRDPESAAKLTARTAF